MKPAIVIKRQKNGTINNEDRLDLCRLLIKFGYSASITKVAGKSEYVVLAYEPTEDYKGG